MIIRTLEGGSRYIPSRHEMPAVPAHLAEHPMAQVAARAVLTRSQLKTLHGWNAIETVEKGHPNFLRIGWANTPLELWLRYCERPHPEACSPLFFQNYKGIRSRLGVEDLPHPDWLLLAYLAVFGEDGVRAEPIRWRLGNCTTVVQDAMRRLCRLIGRQYMAPVKSVWDDPKQVFEALPDWARGLFEAHLGRECHPPIRPLEPTLVSRVRRLSAEPLRLLGALALIDKAAQRLCKGRRMAVASGMEIASRVLACADLKRAGSIERDFLAYLTDESNDRAFRWRVTDVKTWFELQRGARAMVLLVAGDRAKALIEALPALAAPTAAIRNAMRTPPGTRSSDETPEPPRSEGTPSTAAPLPAHAGTVLDMVSRLIDIQAAAENRVNQLETLLNVVMDVLPQERRKLDAGLRSGFQTPPMRVIRANGTLGDGEQREHFEIVSEGTLFGRALARDPADRLARDYHPPHRGPDRHYGRRHDPANWSRLHLVHCGSSPVVPGGECVEPFWVDQFRWGLFEPEGKFSNLVRVRRIELARAAGIPQLYKPMSGLLSHSRGCLPVVRAARGSGEVPGDLVIPLVPLYHAMATARVILRYGIRWGARLGEILQFRVGCGGVHRVDGVPRPYVELKPKGWAVMGRFGMDDGTARAFAALRAFTNMRFHGGRLDDEGRPWLPVYPAFREDLPAAAYILVAEGRPLWQEEASLLVQVLLAGVLDFASHNDRRVFATALGLDGVGYEQLGVLLHHSPISAMPAKYDLSSLIVSDDAALRFNQRQDAGAIGNILHG